MVRGSDIPVKLVYFMEIAEDNPCHQPGRDHCGLSDLTQDNLEIASLSMIENNTSRDRRGDMRLEVVTEIEHFRDLWKIGIDCSVNMSRHHCR